MTQPNESNSSETPKLIIDEDWKTQVEREREEARQRKTAIKEETSSRKTDDSPIPPSPPPASFPILVSMLATQALAAMGQLGDEAKAPAPRLDYAKHYIDLLGVIEDKTKNNLSPEEAKMIGDWLYQLRIGYVELVKKSTM